MSTKHMEKDGLSRALLAWFDSHARVLPWRERRTLYGTWISEIMLQQTTVATVVPYWHRFMSRFPTVQDLALAEESEVLALWSGLGYYRRARNLHRAARIIVEKENGCLPGDRAGWKKLPGVGAYASGAIASMGLGISAPAVDANARRVLGRWLFDEPDAAARISATEWEKIALELVPPDQPGPWNEALMELGALLCRHDSTRCDQCPVLDFCQAGLAGVALAMTPRKEKLPPTAVDMAVVVFRRKGKVFLLPPNVQGPPCPSEPWERAREDTSSIHQGLWSLPGTPWYSASPFVDAELSRRGFIQKWLTAWTPLPKEVVLRYRSFFRHAITRYRLQVRVWEVVMAGVGEETGGWLRDEFFFEQGNIDDGDFEFPISSLVSRSLACASENVAGP